MTEREMFLNTWAAEQAITMKILRAYPESHIDLKPAEKSTVAKDLAWTFVAEQALLIDGAISGHPDFSKFAPTPATWAEVIAGVEAGYPEAVAKVKGMSDESLNEHIDWQVGKGTVAKVRRGDILWMALHDMIHHRGQLSVYLRIAGAKVPSIYGPSADEPWN